MIVVAIRGGLGNQLFQYAIGRRLSLRHNVPLTLDLTWYEESSVRSGMTDRMYELGRFKVASRKATKEEIQTVKAIPSALFRGRTALALLGIVRPRGWIRERTPFVYDRFAMSAGADAYLDGYWQNEKYFSRIASTLRDDLQIKIAPGRETSLLLQSIRESESVGIHVRRGDYLNGTGSHAICTAEYYHNAIERMLARFPKAKLFVFSDDQGWVAKNISAAAPLRFVTHNNSANAYDDLRMLAACKHQIISNSTFSWWGAWLNSSPDKTVFAPRLWFTNSEVKTSTLMPSGWHQLG